MKVHDAAQVIMGNMPAKDLPPIVLAVVIQVVADIITEYGPTFIDKLVNHKPLNICDKLVIKYSVKKCCATPQDYKTYGRVIIDAVVKSCDQFTPAQVKGLMDDVKTF